jgi:hypothetical protein
VLPHTHAAHLNVEKNTSGQGDMKMSMTLVTSTAGQTTPDIKTRVVRDSCQLSAAVQRCAVC